MMMGMYAATGRIFRGFMHRAIYHAASPLLAPAGLLPAHGEHAAEVLKLGYISGVIPGGAEEALTGHENAFKLHPLWRVRKGWITIARQARVPIVPYFLKNGEEMRFTFIFYLWNKIGGSKVYDRIINSKKTPRLVV
jgi:hypothetical protein